MHGALEAGKARRALARAPIAHAAPSAVGRAEGQLRGHAPVARLAAPSRGATAHPFITQAMEGAAVDARCMHLACFPRPSGGAHTLARMADAPAVAVPRAVGHAHRNAAVDAAEADGADALTLDARAVAGA